MACSHVWIDPSDPPIARQSYSPVIGERAHEMKIGRVYRCQRCGAECNVSPNSKANHRLFARAKEGS